MLDYLLQLISVIILIFVIVTVKTDERLKQPNIQILLAVVIMLIFVFIDPLAGFILVIALFVLYYKTMYVTSYKPDVNNRDNSGSLRKANLDSIYNSYITPAHLDSAQNNIVGDLEQPVLGFNPSSINPELVLSNAQGLDKNMPGYDNIVYQELE